MPASSGRSSGSCLRPSGATTTAWQPRSGRSQDLRHAIEFRHPTWFADPVLELLRAHDVALVIADRPEIASFQLDELTAGFTFIRFHHGARGRRGNYSERELEEWARRIDGWRSERDVYAYFNNDWEGFAPANALRLRELLEGVPGRTRRGVEREAAADRRMIDRPSVEALRRARRASSA